MSKSDAEPAGPLTVVLVSHFVTSDAPPPSGGWSYGERVALSLRAGA